MIHIIHDGRDHDTDGLLRPDVHGLAVVRPDTEEMVFILRHDLGREQGLPIATYGNGIVHGEETGTSFFRDTIIDRVRAIAGLSDVFHGNLRKTK